MSLPDRVWLPDGVRRNTTPGGWLDRARREPATSPVAPNRAQRRQLARVVARQQKKGKH